MTLIEDLTTAAAHAKTDAKAFGIVAARLDAAAKAEAERLRLGGHGGDRHTTQAGVLRCDGLGKPPTPVVEDRDAFASFVAERAPEQVTTTVTVPADKLEALLALCEFEGITATALVAVKSTEVFLRDADLVPDAAAPSGWVAVHPTHGPVPGVGGQAPSLRWVLTPSKTIVGPAEARAMEDADALVAGLTGADTPADVDAVPVVPVDAAEQVAA